MILKKSLIFIFLRHVFTLTAGKMVNAFAHQRNIFKIQKPVDKLLFRPRTINFLILSRDPVLLNKYWFVFGTSSLNGCSPEA
jgi:hypothetical protein